METITVILVIIIVVLFFFRKKRSKLDIKTTVNDKLFRSYSKLMKEATVLKKEGDIDQAIVKINDAYKEAEKKGLTLTVNDYLKLPPYLQLAGRNDEAWGFFNKLIQTSSSDPMSLSQIYDKMRLFRQREKAHTDAVKYAVLSNLYRCLGLHQQVSSMGWKDRQDELDDCRSSIDKGYEKYLKKANASHLEKELQNIISLHVKTFPRVKTSELIKDIDKLLKS